MWKVEKFWELSAMSRSNSISLEQKGVWDLIDGTKPPFAENATAVTIRNWDKKIAIAYNIIKLDIGLELYANIIRE